MRSHVSAALKRTSRLKPALAAGLLALLAACGGGNDDSSPPPAAQSATASPAPAATAPSIVSSSESATYPAGSEELAAFTLLNTERNRCGFGLLAQSAPLDRAARAHADYMVIHGTNSHLENQSLNPEGFTGTDPQARVRAQGYTDLGGVTDENAFFTSSNPAFSKQGVGELGTRALLNAPYHLNGLMSGYRDAGFAVRSNADTGKGPTSAVVQINAAYKAGAGPQLLGDTDVKTYPCDGATRINRQLTNETPNPVPGRDLRINPLGSTVYVAVREGNRLAIASAAMTVASTGQAVLLRTPVTAANDPYGPCTAGCFLAHQAYISADAPLQPNTAYMVVVRGTNNGQEFSRTFTFTTGG